MHWTGRNRRLVVAAICALCTAATLASHFFPDFPFVSAVWQQEQTYENFLQRQGRKTVTRPEFVFLGIDQNTLELPPLLPEDLENNRALQLMQERPFPWSREVWALLLDRLFEARARLVIFDFLFNPPNDGDPVFRQALEKYRDRVVVAANIDIPEPVAVAPGTQRKRWNRQITGPNSTLIPPPTFADDRVGYADFWPDSVDGIVRGIIFTTSERDLAGQEPFPDEEIFQSLSARALQKLGRANAVPLDRRQHLIRFSDNTAYPARPLYEVFDPKLWQANYGGGTFFRDKVVMVGASAQIMHDVVATPFDLEMPGPVVHLQAIAAALDGEFLRATSRPVNFLLVAIAGILAWMLVALIRRPLLSLLALLLVSVAWLAIARLAFDRAGWLILVVPVLVTFLGSGFISLGLEYVLERIERLRTRRTLERYVSKNLVKEVLDNPTSFYSSLRGVRIPATILFSDIVGFTSMTESADPEALVKQLNEYLERMTVAVFKHDGTLDKFVGDAVMAVWGNVSSRGVAEDAKACARAALEMRRELQVLNEKWKAQGIAPFVIGIGINQGEVIGGNIGSPEKADPTVIGDAVNLASRLEGLTRVYHADILVGSSACELIRDEFCLRSVALVRVKGKTKPIEIFALIGAMNAPGNEALELYESGFRKFRERKFTEAKDLFARFLESCPGDALAVMYRERAAEYEKLPPDESWNGVEVFEKK